MRSCYTLRRRWLIGLMLLGSIGAVRAEARDRFTVGAVSEEQATELGGRVQALRERADRFRGMMQAAEPDLMYRNLLIMQMTSLGEPLGALVDASRTSPPWWTPEAYQAEVTVLRLIALTRNETKKLRPPMMAALRDVWKASDDLLDIVDRIEHGARRSGPDAEMIYRPRPGSHDE